MSCVHIIYAYTCNSLKPTDSCMNYIFNLFSHWYWSEVLVVVVITLEPNLKAKFKMCSLLNFFRHADMKYATTPPVVCYNSSIQLSCSNPPKPATGGYLCIFQPFLQPSSALCLWIVLRDFGVSITTMYLESTYVFLCVLLSMRWSWYFSLENELWTPTMFSTCFLFVSL